MRKKASLSLSVEIIVVMIIGLVVMASGFLLFKKFISGAEELKERLDVQTEEKLSQMLEEGRTVAISHSSKKIKRGESFVFGLGILNTGEEETTFNINISVDKFYNKSNEVESLDQNKKEKIKILYPNNKTISAKEKETIGFLVKVEKEALSGKYFLLANVTTSEVYGREKLEIEVP